MLAARQIPSKVHFAGWVARRRWVKSVSRAALVDCLAGCEKKALGGPGLPALLLLTNRDEENAGRAKFGPGNVAGSLVDLLPCRKPRRHHMCLPIRGTEPFYCSPSFVCRTAVKFTLPVERSGVCACI